jgi:hypothetical protein
MSADTLVISAAMANTAVGSRTSTRDLLSEADGDSEATCSGFVPYLQ